MPPIDRCPSCFKDAVETPCRSCGWRPGDETPAPYLPVGALLHGCYHIGRVLGHGGFGITYLGWDDNLALKLAIKEYFPRDFATRAGDASSVSVYSGEARRWFDYGLQRFQEEARTLARFQQHPGIVTVYNFFRANDTGYMVMEYVTGITLKAYLERKGVIPYETARRALLPVMDALRAVHEQGLLHRDVSPDNIYITKLKQVKLLDFGAARFAAGEHSRSLSVILKPGYAPEEQYRSKGRQGPWTDVYGMAATLYRCVTGEIPPEALDRMDEETLEMPSALGVAIPHKAEQALLGGLALKATDRPQSMAVFQQAFLRKSPTATKPAARSPAPPPATKSSEEKAEYTLTPTDSRAVTGLDAKKTAGTGPVRRTSASRDPGPRTGKGNTRNVRVSPVLLVVGVCIVALVALLFGGISQDRQDAEVPTVSGSVDADLLDAAAQYEKGLAFRRCDGVAQDDAATVKWCRKAAEQGYAMAQNSLGVMYDNGRGVAEDDAAAARWYRKAAEQGFAMAQFNLGVMYAKGTGVPEDDAKAVKWYRKAAEQGNDGGQYSLGVMYDNGWGVVEDDAKAVKWYRKAAEQGYVMAQYKLGLMYTNGWGVAEDDAKAVKWYRKAAEQRDVMAQYNLGVMYELGRGVLQDQAEAKKWFKNAADNGVSHKDMVTSYRNGAFKGEMGSQYWLGVMYAVGRGVKRNLANAKYWLKKAAAQGHTGAKETLQQLKPGQDHRDFNERGRSGQVDVYKAPYSGAPISLNYNSIDIKRVIALLSDFVGLKFYVDASVAGTVSVRYKNVPWDQILDEVMKKYSLEMVEYRDGHLLRPKAQSGAAISPGVVDTDTKYEVTFPNGKKATIEGDIKKLQSDMRKGLRRNEPGY